MQKSQPTNYEHDLPTLPPLIHINDNTYRCTDCSAVRHNLKNTFVVFVSFSKNDEDYKVHKSKLIENEG
jgi:hypothetical protein